MYYGGANDSVLTTADIITAQTVGEHTQQIADIQNCIMRDEGIMRRELQALSMCLARLEEKLGITEPVVAPGD